MNKYYIATAVLSLLILLMLGYRALSLGVGEVPQPTGPLTEITVHMLKESWTYDPETIDAVVGERIRFTLVNDDSVDHGFAIDALGLSVRVPKGQTMDIAPITFKQPGDFQYYCSIVCSEGVASSGLHKNEQRGHFDMIGIIHVHR